MRELVDAQPTARAARALRVVELEVLGLDLAVDEVVCAAAQALVEILGFRLARAIHDVRLQQTIAYQQCSRNSGLDRLLVLAADDEAIDHGIHAPHFGLVKLDFTGNINALAIDDDDAAALPAD